MLDQLPDHQPVTNSHPLKLLMHFIDMYKSLRDASPDNELIWLLKNTFLVVKNVTKMTFSEGSGNMVENLPHILSGKLEAKHLLPNVGAHVYVIALSEGALASMVFVVLLTTRILGYATFIWLMQKCASHVYQKFILHPKLTEKHDKFINVSSKELTEDKEGPVYLQKYIRKRNAE